MAVSDFVYPVTVIPVQLTQIATSSWHWHITGIAGLVFCKLINFMQDVSISVSIQSLVWIALDRFVAVVLPMKAHLISSRFRAFAIASTWIVAMVGNCLGLYIHELIDEREEAICTTFYNDTLLVRTYERIRTIVFLIVPLVAITILYCVIAVRLRRQDNFLQCRVHQKDQRKQRAIKMSFCIMAAFYMSFLPMLSFFLIRQYEIAVPCLFWKALWFLAPSAVYFSSMLNPIICMLFIQSYRHGLKEILNSCCCKRLNTHNMETGEQQEISLQEIGVTATKHRTEFAGRKKRQTQPCT
ncbi:G-protein coupled receptor 15-like [Oculina patagonica]